MDENKTFIGLKDIGKNKIYCQTFIRTGLDNGGSLTPDGCKYLMNKVSRCSNMIYLPHSENSIK